MRRHSVDVFSLMSGVLFFAIAIAYLVGAYSHLHVDARLVLPALLVGLGLAGLAAAITAQVRADRRPTPALDAGLPEGEDSLTGDAEPNGDVIGEGTREAGLTSGP